MMTGASGQLNCAPETGLRLRRVGVFAQKQLPSPAKDLGCIHGFESLLGNLRQHVEAPVRHAGPGIGLGEETEEERIKPEPPGRTRYLMQPRELGFLQRINGPETRQESGAV